MARNLLTDRQVQNAKPKAKPNAKPYRLADGDGLYLFVPTSTKDARAWQYRYRHEGKPQTLTLGKLSRMTISQARTAAERARVEAAQGKHLTQEKRLSRVKRRADAKNTFEAVVRDWIHSEARRAKWSSAYREEVQASLRNHLSDLNALPLAKISAPVTAPLLRKVERTAPHMVEKIRRRLHAILDYGVEQGVIIGNPLPATRRGVKVDRRHFPAVTDLKGLGTILRAARMSDPCKGIQRAHILLAYTGMRVSEVVGAAWKEFALDGAEIATIGAVVGDRHRAKFDPDAGNWTIPRERMKRKGNDESLGPHVVPLPPTLLAQLREWRTADGDGAIYVCPAPRDAAKAITAEAIEKHYRVALDLGGKHSPHSWRSAFSTVAREAGKDGDVIEAQLDHVVGNKVAASYDRAKRLELRRELVAWYEGMLIAARDGASVVKLHEHRTMAS